MSSKESNNNDNVLIDVLSIILIVILVTAWTIKDKIFNRKEARSFKFWWDLKND